MQVIHANPHEPIPLGRQGEHLARRIAFDLSGWQKQYGQGTARLIHQRQEDLYPYPVVTVQEDGSVLWDVTRTDTDQVCRYGRAELRYFVGDAVVKSAVYQTRVDPAMAPPTAEAPQAGMDWIERLLEAAASAEETAAQVTASGNLADQAVQDAQSAQSAAESAAADAEAARQAVENLGVTASALAQGSSPTVTKTVLDGAVTLNFGLSPGRDALLNGENTLTIQQGENVTITQESGVLTIAARVPEKTSDLTNDAAFQTEAQVHSAIDARVSSAYKAAGSAALANLPALTQANLGLVVNLSEGFITTADFVEGAGKPYPAGTNVVVAVAGENTYKYDVLAGMVDLSGKQDKLPVTGAANRGVYVSADGTVTAMTHTVDADVPSNAVFTDTTYTPATASPLMDGTAAVGTSAKYAREDHTHPADTSLVPKTTTVNGKALSGNITLDKSDVGLGNVENTSDAEKPISTATQAALDQRDAQITQLQEQNALLQEIVRQMDPSVYKDTSGNPIVIADGYDGAVLQSVTVDASLAGQSVTLTRYGVTRDGNTPTASETLTVGTDGTLENVTLTTLLGENVIYANDGTNNIPLTIRYRADTAYMQYATYPAKTASGNPASFTDGAEDVPVKALTVQIAAVQPGSGDPSPENIRPITGWDSVTVSRTDGEGQNAQSVTLSTGSAGTVYGGTLDVVTGKLTVTHGIIASYAGETLPGAWTSDRDVYAAGTTPTTGAQVVYELAASLTYPLTPAEVRTLLGENHISADTGSVEAEYRADVGLAFQAIEAETTALTNAILSLGTNF